MTIPQQHQPARSQRISLSISIATHLVIGLLLIWFGIFSSAGGSAPEADRSGGIVLTEISADKEVEYIDQTDAQQSQVSDAFDESEELTSSPSAAVAAAAEAPQLDIPDLPDLPGVPVSQTPMTNANAMAEAPVSPRKAARYELTQADLDLIAKDRAHFKSLQPKGNATTISLFEGGGMTGRKFVFVVDRSHSMGGDGLGALDAVRSQLTAAIGALENNHEFQIVAYHDKTTMISKRKLLVANEQNKGLVKDFFEGLGAFGATKHFYGLIAGLDFQPDVLVFMTDGGSPYLSTDQLKRLKNMAGRQTEIHCIQFGSGSLQQTDNFMKKLARQNGGSFRYINVRQWR